MYKRWPVSVALYLIMPSARVSLAGAPRRQARVIEIDVDVDTEIDFRETNDAHQTWEDHGLVAFAVDGDDELALTAEEFVDTEVFEVAAVGDVDKGVTIRRSSPTRFAEEVAGAWPPSLSPRLRDGGGLPVLGHAHPVGQADIQQRASWKLAWRRWTTCPSPGPPRRAGYGHRRAQVEIAVEVLPMLGVEVIEDGASAKVFAEQEEITPASPQLRVFAFRQIPALNDKG